MDGFDLNALLANVVTVDKGDKGGNKGENNNAQSNKPQHVPDAYDFDDLFSSMSPSEPRHVESKVNNRVTKVDDKHKNEDDDLFSRMMNPLNEVPIKTEVKNRKIVTPTIDTGRQQGTPTAIEVKSFVSPKPFQSEVQSSIRNRADVLHATNNTTGTLAEIVSKLSQVDLKKATEDANKLNKRISNLEEVIKECNDASNNLSSIGSKIDSLIAIIERQSVTINKLNESIERLTVNQQRIRNDLDNVLSKQQ